MIEEASSRPKPVGYRGRGGGKVYSRPRSRAIAVVSRCTVFGPPALFDRGRVCARRGTSWTVSSGVAGWIGKFSNETIGDLNDTTTDGL